MTHTHTHGPWITECNCIRSERGSQRFDLVAIVPLNHDERGANARLISSAPELLATLEDAEFLLRKAGLMAGPMRDSFNRSASDARAAIAKATGKESA